MAIVNGSLELGYKNTAWFTANPTVILKEGQIVYLEQTGQFKIGDGVTQLSALSFLGISAEAQTLQNVTDLGNTTTNDIEANAFVKTGGTSSEFLKADGSVDTTSYLSTQVVPIGGTAGQILAKVDDTDYNLEWIENYANYTSVLKHTVKASQSLTKGQAVYVSSATGTNMIVSKASNVSEATSSKTMGLIAQDLATNGIGFVITEGLLGNLNTSTATIGNPVWLGVDGELIYGLTNKPYAPAHLVFIGIVTRVSATVGEIFVKVQNGFELNEIHDVDLKTTVPINGHLLGFDGTLWVNKTIASWLGYTPYDASNPSGYITSSALTPYLTSATASSTYYPLTNPSGYISGITSGMVTTALGFTPYNATNPDGYITSSALTSYVPYTGATANVDLGIRTLTTPTINGVSGNLSFANAVQISGAVNSFSFTKPNNTGQTASTSIAGWNYIGGTRQWATGTITTQSENVWGATTYSFVGASTIINAYGNVFNAPIAGTNATINNSWAAQFNGNVQIGSTGQLIEMKQATNLPTITLTGTTGSQVFIKSGTRTLAFESYGGDANYFSSTGSDFIIRTTDSRNVVLRTNNTTRITIGADGTLNIAESSNFRLGTTTGTKIADATNQKLSFWNATPIIQPTTTVSASTFVTNTSGILNDTATFDGYTIGQIVKALRNMGILA